MELLSHPLIAIFCGLRSLPTLSCLQCRTPSHAIARLSSQRMCMTFDLTGMEASDGQRSYAWGRAREQCHGTVHNSHDLIILTPRYSITTMTTRAEHTVSTKAIIRPYFFWGCMLTSSTGPGSSPRGGGWTAERDSQWPLIGAVWDISSPPSVCTHYRVKRNSK